MKYVVLSVLLLLIGCAAKKPATVAPKWDTEYHDDGSITLSRPCPDGYDFYLKMPGPAVCVKNSPERRTK